MTISQDSDIQSYVHAIKASGFTIYDPITVGDPKLWIPTPELEALLDKGLRGLSLLGLPLRTRSKVVKEQICQILGYPSPERFKKTRPRFPGQLFDTYVQKANNLQIWNDELSPTRRYVLIRVSPLGDITRVKAVTGDSLAILDTTGTLTKKYQAHCGFRSERMELIAQADTELLRRFVSARVVVSPKIAPSHHPEARTIYSIKSLYKLLAGLIGEKFKDAGVDQERNRGEAIHRLVCKRLGYAVYRDDGQFPDVRHQLLEVKLQTSPTIDLGLVLPTSTEPLDVPMIEGNQIRHCDVRYAIFRAGVEDGIVTITHLILTTGESFFTRFHQFGGKVLNAKLQIPLPATFFEG